MSATEGKAPRKRALLGLWRKSGTSSPAPATPSHHLLHDVSGDYFFKVPMLRPVKSNGGQQYARVGSIYVHFHAGIPVRQVELHVEKEPRILVGVLHKMPSANVCVSRLYPHTTFAYVRPCIFRMESLCHFSMYSQRATLSQTHGRALNTCSGRTAKTHWNAAGRARQVSRAAHCAVRV